MGEPFKSSFLQLEAEEVREIRSMRMIPCTLLSLEMEGNTCQGMWWLLEAESGPWLIASKEMGTSSYSCWELG